VFETGFSPNSTVYVFIIRPESAYGTSTNTG
jgi:hypothetical protein